jgi:SAM-dependent methyltransferase
MSEANVVKFSVPEKFRRGSLRHDERTSVDSAIKLLDLINSYASIKDAKILDFGCGVKLVQGLIEKGNPQLKYTGVDVYEEMISYLVANCPYKGFEFKVLNFYNEMYNNKKSQKMNEESNLPIDPDKFDIITMFSVVTHLNPEDTLATLKILRKYTHNKTKLIFSTFVDEDQKENFIDKVPEKPLLKAYYRKSFMEDLIANSGWSILSLNKPIPRLIQHYYVCQPV